MGSARSLPVPGPALALAVPFYIDDDAIGQLQHASVIGVVIDTFPQPILAMQSR